MKTKKIKKKKINFDKHLGCPAYPMCDEHILGCVQYCKSTNNEIEFTGYKD